MAGAYRADAASSGDRSRHSGPFELHRHPESSRWTPRQFAVIGDYLESVPQRLPKTVVVERDGVLIGDLMLDLKDAWHQAELVQPALGAEANLGWVLDPGEHGQGIGTEVVRALIGICFEQLGVRRVTADCFAANTASWKIMERVGMRREIATRESSLHRDGRWYDDYGYAMLRAEWDILERDARGR